jgi:integral membrane sensor domain MASE1
MNRAGTGEGKFTALFSVPNAARYVLELAIVAAGYAGLAEAGQMLPSINLTATPLWPPTGLALALFLLRGYRIWPAILLGSFFFQWNRGPLIFSLRLCRGRHAARGASRCMAH